MPQHQGVLTSDDFGCHILTGNGWHMVFAQSVGKWCTHIVGTCGLRTQLLANVDNGVRIYGKKKTPIVANWPLSPDSTRRVDNHQVVRLLIGMPALWTPDNSVPAS